MLVIITRGLIWTPIRVRVKRCLKQKKETETENLCLRASTLRFLMLVVFFLFQILTSAPAILMTATVSSLASCITQQGPSVVHVTILILEMEELAILYQQVIIVVQFEKPCYAKTA